METELAECRVLLFMKATQEPELLFCAQGQLYAGGEIGPVSDQCVQLGCNWTSVTGPAQLDQDNQTNTTGMKSTQARAVHAKMQFSGDNATLVNHCVQLEWCGCT